MIPLPVGVSSVVVFPGVNTRIYIFCVLVASLDDEKYLDDSAPPVFVPSVFPPV